MQEFEMKKRELQKKAIVHNKELEIRQLQDSISKLDAEILSAKDRICNHALYLEVKFSRVQELERGKLESTLDWEGRSMELLMQ